MAKNLPMHAIKNRLNFEVAYNITTYNSKQYQFGLNETCYCTIKNKTYMKTVAKFENWDVL